MAASVERDFIGMEHRRHEAARLLRSGTSQAEVARRLGVSRQSVSRWAQALEREGLRGLRRAKRAGRPPQLDETQLKRLVRLLKAGPEAAGFTTGLWTLSRVRQVTEQQFGVRFGTTRVWQLLHGLVFSPDGRARQRDEAAIELGKRKRRPQLKKTLPPKDG